MITNKFEHLKNNVQILYNPGVEISETHTERLRAVITTNGASSIDSRYMIVQHCTLFLLVIIARQPSCWPNPAHNVCCVDLF